MVSRRTLFRGLGRGAVLAALPLLSGPAVSAAPAAAAPATLPLSLMNRRTDKTAYAHVLGRDARGWFFLTAGGSAYRPTPAGPGLTPLTAATGIPVPPGGLTRATMPRMSSGRVFLSLGRPLTFFVTADGGIAAPSVTNSADPDAGTEWGFCEFTFDGNGLYANISMVDFAGLPVGLKLTGANGWQRVGGLKPDAVTVIAAGLEAQSRRDGSGWADLVVRRGGAPIRVLSPNLAGPDSRVGRYLDPYIAQVWERYRRTDLVVDTQYGWGRLTGRVGADDRLTFAGAGSFARPSTFAVYNCSTAPFVTSNDVLGNLSARLAAALNRGTLLDNPVQPDASAGKFYAAPLTNHYARLVHAAAQDGAGYAFPYDDVHSAGYNFEGRVVDPAPTRLTVLAG